MSGSIISIPTDLPGKRKVLKELKANLASEVGRCSAENEAMIQHLKEWISIFEDLIEAHNKDLAAASSICMNN